MYILEGRGSEGLDQVLQGLAGQLRQRLVPPCSDLGCLVADGRREALSRACDAANDLYRDTCEGLYCVGCEHYITPDELDGAGHCPEHGALPQRVAERT